MQSDELEHPPTLQCETSPEPAGIPNSNIESLKPPVLLNDSKEISMNLFTGVFLIAENHVRLKFAYWIRLFVYYGGIILSQDDRRLATHVLHACDEESFEDVEKYYDLRDAVHINVEWIKAAIMKGHLQDDRPYRVVLLPGKRLHE